VQSTIDQNEKDIRAAKTLELPEKILELREKMHDMTS
jgi:hypothetical protein